MINKETDLPIDEEARLQAAVNRVESEVQLFKTWLASEPRQPARAPNASGAMPARSGQTQDKPSPRRASAPAPEVRSIELFERAVSQLKWGGLIAVVLILFAALAVLVTGYRNTQTILQQIALPDLQITEPADGASVSDGQTLRGNTPYPSLKHYIVLTYLKTGRLNVHTASVSSAGMLAGEITLNSEPADASSEPKEIALRVLATQEQLIAGPLTAFPDDARFSRQIRLWLKPVEQVAISSPAEGETVGLLEPVVGNTRLGHLKHYVVVTPLKSGTPFIQAQPAMINSGSLTGDAQFGTQSRGIGERFAVEIMATSATLSPGPLTNKPTDAVTSKPVTVSRR